MADITKLSISELEADLLDTKNDIVVCQTALEVGVTEYSAGTVQHRLDVNIKIEKIIEKELKRRNQND